MRDICVCTQVGDVCPSARDVTKHGGRCPSPTGVKNVCDGVGIDSKDIYAYQRCSLLVQRVIIDDSYLLRKKRSDSEGN